MDELDQELLYAIEASIAGTMIKPQWVFDHIIATVRKYAAQRSAQADEATAFRQVNHFYVDGVWDESS